MKFDEPLWRALVDFLRRYDEAGEVSVIADLRRRRREQSLEAFLGAWEATPPDDRDPPQAVLLRVRGILRLCMVTDPWARLGGPEPYHDSYTHSLYADRDLSAEVPAYLAAAPGAEGWTLAPGLLSPARDGGWWARVRGWVERAI